MDNAVIIDAVRSPTGRGKPGGALSGVHPVDLLAQVLGHLVSRTGVDPALVEDVIMGCVSQSSEQAFTPGRMAWLGAGFPAHVPATTIDRRCGSSQQALVFAAQSIIAGGQEVVIAGGIESMSRVPMGSARMGADIYGPMATERFAPGLISQGVAAELVASKWAIDREQLDELSAESHRRAAKAAAEGWFESEIVPIHTPSGVVSWDETIRTTTTVEQLADLRPAFRSSEMSERFPEIHWSITAGNSSQISDGASACLVTSERAAERLGLNPVARYMASAVCGDDPLLMLSGPIPATASVLTKAGLKIDDIDHVEVNEAFASVPLAWQAEFGVDSSRLNPVGGAIALGHPLGASGGRLLATMTHSLTRTGARYGLQAMCEAGGMANATVIERL